MRKYNELYRGEYMRLEKISEKNRPLLTRAFALYESSFPIEERRDRKEQERVFAHPDYHCDLILENSDLVGILFYWEREEFVFLEHFATLPEIRGSGKGSQALELLKNKGKTVILEIEPPVDELTNRRYAFYRRNGFFMTPHYHIQAKYRLTDKDVELKILSYPRPITREEYLAFRAYMDREIGISTERTDLFDQL